MSDKPLRLLNVPYRVCRIVIRSRLDPRPNLYADPVVMKIYVTFEIHDIAAFDIDLVCSTENCRLVRRKPVYPYQCRHPITVTDSIPNTIPQGQWRVRTNF